MASIPELAEEADRIAGRLSNVADMLEAEYSGQPISPKDRRNIDGTVEAVRTQAVRLRTIARQYPRAQSQVLAPDRITPALILSMITEAAVQLEATQGGLLLIGADLLSGAASPAQVAKAMDSARDTIADGAKALVVLGQIIGEGLPMDQPTAGGMMVQMKPEAFQRVMSHLFAVQEWIAGESIGAKHARESLKRAIAIMRGDSEQIDVPVAARAASEDDPPRSWVLRFRVSEPEAQIDLADRVRANAEQIARFLGVEGYLFVQANRTVFVKPVIANALQVWKAAIFASEQFGWVMEEPEAPAEADPA